MRRFRFTIIFIVLTAIDGFLWLWYNTSVVGSVSNTICSYTKNCSGGAGVYLESFFFVGVALIVTAALIEFFRSLPGAKPLPVVGTQCPNGHPIFPGDRFCTACGISLTPDDPVDPPDGSGESWPMAEAATGDVKASADLAESSRTPEPADTSSSEHEVGSESDERLEPQSNDRIALTISKRTLKWVGAMSVVVVLAGAAGYGVAQVTSSTSSRSNRAEPQTTTTVAPVSSTQTPPTTGSVTTPPPAVSQPRGANLACDRSALLRVLYRDAPSSESPLPPNLSPESPPVCLTVRGTRYAAERFLWPGQSNIVGIFEPSADGGTWTLMTGWGDSCLGLVPDQIRGAFLPSGIC